MFKDHLPETVRGLEENYGVEVALFDTVAHRGLPRQWVALAADKAGTPTVAIAPNEFDAVTALGACLEQNAQKAALLDDLTRRVAELEGRLRDQQQE